MPIIDSGPAQLKPPQPKEDKKQLREFLARSDDAWEKHISDEADDLPRDPYWELIDFIQTHGYKKTKSVFQRIEQDLITESKNLLGDLGKVVSKNKTLDAKWQAFNKKMGEPTTIYWKSLPSKKSEKTEDKPKDLLSMIRSRQNKISN